MAKLHGRRGLLNGPGFHSTAAIVAEITDSGDNVAWDKPYYPSRPQPTLVISDCDRSIDFDFNGDTAEGMRNDQRKLDTLIDALTKLRDGIAIENERFRARERAFKAHKKKFEN